MDYKEALQYLYSSIPMFHRIGAAAFKPDLSNIIALSDHLGKPQNDFKSVHIAGTNGKGSTAHLLSAILQHAGYKVGLYTSPHYKDFRERIKINGVYISEAEVSSFVSRTKEFVDILKPSFFELTVGMAFEHFSRHQVDIAVIEVGMGGRLDATNIISPECAVITNIGFDHEQFLGDSLAKIAAEKAGIIKNEIPTVIGEFNSETFPVFESIANIRNSTLYAAFDILKAVLRSESISENGYDIYKDGKLFLEDLKTGMTGSYQQKNIITVLSAIEILKERGFKLTEKNIRAGLRDVKKMTNIIGRWEILQEKPLIICDSAHNSHGLSYVKAALEKLPYKNLHIVFGMVSDKDPKKMLAELPNNGIFYLCKANIPRGLETEKLQIAAAELGLLNNTYDSVEAAFTAAKKAAAEEDVIFVGGSIFVVAEVI
jgi:dihydrofolate synthase / folylpolyglutamate synthase